MSVITWHTETRPLKWFKPWDRNPRIFTEKGMSDLGSSIDRFGLAEPIITNTDGTVIGGHARLRVLHKSGYPVAGCMIPSRKLTAGEVDELNIRLNANIGGVWDWDRLANEWDAVDLEAWGLEVPGFDPVDEQRDVDAEPQLDKADEFAKSWGVKPGQLWRCGEHRILCGDSAKPEDVERVMAREHACLVFTDPPYGVSQGAKNRLLDTVGKAGKSATIKKNIVDDDLSPEELKSRLVPAFTNIRKLVMADDCTVFVTAPQGGELGMMMMMMQESGLKVRHVLIWKKDAPTSSMGRLDYDYQHEPILLTWGKRHKRPMKGEHRTSVWEIPKPRSSGEHPTMKPVALVVNAMLNNSDAGDVVFDAYSGSGTTMIACEQTGRRARVIEIEPAYVAVALQRYFDATGDAPKIVPSA